MEHSLLAISLNSILVIPFSAICTTRCHNGGNCTAPQTCSCTAGFTGRHCEQDVNECETEKPCDQQCVNTQGSFYCRCRQGFVLQADQQSCRKISSHADDAFEARDLENDIDETDSQVATRLQKIERSLANERVHTNELQKSLQATYSVVDTLKSRLSTLVGGGFYSVLHSNLIVTFPFLFTGKANSGRQSHADESLQNRIAHKQTGEHVEFAIEMPEWSQCQLPIGLCRTWARSGRVLAKHRTAF